MSDQNARLCGKGILTFCAPILALAGMVGLAANSLRAQEAKDKDFSVTVQGPDTDAGLLVSARATAKEVGLPIYPGAIPHKDTDKDDSSAAKLGLWGSSFGFKLVVLKMESKDTPRKVAEYYQKALTKYGPVLDCTNPPPAKEVEDDKSTKLTCGDDKPEKGGMLFKAGTKEKQHIVGVQPNGNGTIFQLLYIEARSEKKPA
ncbi:MAG TPA: hypothetical protein VN850_01895 [Candidatus Acidoferrales bacterium]|nr:hypothetical protein [Candidatus Acidoferrales bacterium]